jgi:hypothetical protein
MVIKSKRYRNLRNQTYFLSSPPTLELFPQRWPLLSPQTAFLPELSKRWREGVLSHIWSHTPPGERRFLEMRPASHSLWCVSAPGHYRHPACGLCWFPSQFWYSLLIGHSTLCPSHVTGNSRDSDEGLCWWSFRVTWLQNLLDLGHLGPVFSHSWADFY